MEMLLKGVSVVMPCLNEEKTIRICITKAKEFLKKNRIEGEVIIADNGSTDNSISIAHELGARVVSIEKKGYGSALRGGIAEALYEYVVMGDADDSYDFSALEGFINKLDEGYDLVMGNRFAGGIEPGAMPFSHQYIGNPFLSGIGRRFFNTNIGDFHCGLRAFRKEKIQELNLCTSGMEFASEMVVKAVLNNLKIAEIPCKLYPDGRERPPHLRSIPDGLRHLEFLLIYSPKWMFAYPGFICTIIGLIFMVTLYIHPIRIGQIQFEVTSMFYSSIAMLIGYQMLQFSVFTVNFGKRIGQFPKVSLFNIKVNKFLTQKGYLTAGLLIVVGIIGVAFTLVLWGQKGFGQLDNTQICKSAIFFGTFLVMGVETLLFTAFSKVLQMGEVNEK